MRAKSKHEIYVLHIFTIDFIKYFIRSYFIKYF
jgi:hypothetical protein